MLNINYLIVKDEHDQWETISITENIVTKLDYIGYIIYLVITDSNN